MKTAALLDTGPLVAQLNRRDQYHGWALEQMARLPTPLLTCEPVLTEAYWLLRHLPQAQRAVLEMLAAGVLTTPFHLREHSADVLVLLDRYADVPMSLADACLVRMAELVDSSVVFTLDSDFRSYRRHRKQKIPLIIPDEV
jgi:predicted nucleic acid-binding protein